MQEIEKELIGLVLDEDRYLSVAEKLRPNHFEDKFYRSVYRSIQNVSSKNNSFSLPLIAKGIKDQGLDALGAMHALKLNAEGDEHDYADTLIDNYHRKVIAEFKGDLDEIIQDDSISGDELIESTISRLLKKFDDQPIDDVYSTRSLTDQVLSPKTPNELGFKTSLTFFDELLGVLLPGQVIVIGGATSSGKSSLAQCLSWKAARSGVSSYLLTNEMTARETMQRILSQVSGVALNKIPSEDRRNAEENINLVDAKKKIDEWPLYIDGKEKTTVASIRIRIQKAIQKYKIRLVVLDHLHDMKPENPRDPEHQQITQMISDIKAMAKSLNVVVVVVAHLNRDAMQGHVKSYKKIERPMMRHLHGSSSIEKYADAVLFVHRPAYFIERMKPTSIEAQADWEPYLNKWKGKAEIIKHKHRQGVGFGIRTVNFEETTTLFYKEQEELGHDF